MTTTYRCVQCDAYETLDILVPEACSFCGGRLTDISTPGKIAARNDAFRASILHGISFLFGRVVATQGVAAHGSGFLLRALAATAAFDTFDADNDPYDQHDFGRFEIDGIPLYWKIDLYEDETLEYGAEDPLGENTVRLLTLLLHSEY